MYSLYQISMHHKFMWIYLISFSFVTLIVIPVHIPFLLRSFGSSLGGSAVAELGSRPHRGLRRSASPIVARGTTSGTRSKRQGFPMVDTRRFLEFNYPEVYGSCSIHPRFGNQHGYPTRIKAFNPNCVGSISPLCI